MEQRSIRRIIVIGSGNWGLTLACLFRRCCPVRVWTVDAEMAARLNANRADPAPFFWQAIPPEIVIEEKFATPFDPWETLLIPAVPSGQVRSVAREIASRADRPLILSVSKGFDAQAQCTLSETFRQEIPGAVVLVLSGPTIAREVADGKPTRAVLAGDDLLHLALVKEALRNDVLFFEVSRSPTHHEICAALKGLVAIAVGLADGLDLGANLQGILMTEGIREMGIVASFFGMPREVAYGLSGSGDLIATCIAPDSRNRKLGTYLAQGMTLKQALQTVGMTVEGVAMSKAIETLWALDVSIPLIHFVNAVLLGRCADIRQGLYDVIRAL